MKAIWPNFFLVGAPKAGTSSLYAYLKQHPEVFLPAIKELHFFSQIVPTSAYQKLILHPVLDEQEYLALFRDGQGYRAIGDASVSYLWAAQAPYRIHERSPDARILIALRDPVERAYSHYLMNVREGLETHSFYEAILLDRQAPKKGWGVSSLYIEAGLYAAPVARYCELFGPDQVKTLLFEDLKKDAKAMMRDIARFLDIDVEAVENLRTEQAHNPYMTHRGSLAAAIMRNRRLRLFAHVGAPKPLRRWIRYRMLLKPALKPPPDPRAIAMLRDIFEPDIEALERLLALPLPSLRHIKCVPSLEKAASKPGF